MPKKNTNWIKGIVDWFDDAKGQGFVRDHKGQWFHVHYSAIETNKKWKSLKPAEKVEFLLINPDHNPKVKRLRRA